MKNPWKTISSKIVYQNPWIKVREDKIIHPDGKKGTYGVVESPPSVFMVALTEEQEVYLVKQYRYTTGIFSWELPGGNTNNQAPLIAAKRELKEETGLEAKSWKELGKFQSMNGVSSEIGYAFLAQDLTQTSSNKMEEEGIKELKKFPLKQVFNMIKVGEITCSLSITTLTQVLISIGRIK